MYKITIEEINIDRMVAVSNEIYRQEIENLDLSLLISFINRGPEMDIRRKNMQVSAQAARDAHNVLRDGQE